MFTKVIKFILEFSSQVEIVITARMSELCRGSQGFPCKGQNGFISVVTVQSYRGANPSNTEYFSSWNSDCTSLLFKIGYIVSLSRIRGYREKEPSVLCLSLEVFIMPTM